MIDGLNSLEDRRPAFLNTSSWSPRALAEPCDFRSIRRSYQILRFFLNINYLFVFCLRFYCLTPIYFFLFNRMGPMKLGTDKCDGRSTYQIILIYFFA